MGAFYEEREHAADVFVEIRGHDLAALYEHGLYALYFNLVDLEHVRPTAEVEIEARGAEPAATLRALLGEALYVFETTGFVAAGARLARAEPQGARAVLQGERLDPVRHGLLSEIKAVTYHRLQAERLPDGGWAATFIFDV